MFSFCSVHVLHGINPLLPFFDIFQVSTCVRAYRWLHVRPGILDKRQTEHKRATRNGDLNCNSNIAEHHLHRNHRIDWDSAECVIYSTDCSQRRGGGSNFPYILLNESHSNNVLTTCKAIIEAIASGF